MFRRGGGISTSLMVLARTQKSVEGLMSGSQGFVGLSGFGDIGRKLRVNIVLLRYLNNLIIFDIVRALYKAPKSLCRKLKFPIPISIEPDGVNLKYFKFRLF